MTDPLTVAPGNVIEIGNAAICACDPDPDKCHVYDTALYNGRCPRGSERSVLLANILKTKKQPEAQPMEWHIRVLSRVG